MATEAQIRQRAIKFVQFTGQITINNILAGRIEKSPAVEKLRAATRRMRDPATKRAMQDVLARMIAAPEPAVEPSALPSAMVMAEPALDPTPEPTIEMVDTEEEEPVPDPTALAPGIPEPAPYEVGSAISEPVPFQQVPMQAPLAEEKDPFSKTWVLAIPLIVAVIPFLLGRN